MLILLYYHFLKQIISMKFDHMFSGIIARFGIVEKYIFHSFRKKGKSTILTVVAITNWQLRIVGLLQF